MSILSLSVTLAQSANGDKVMGVWLSEAKDAKIEIFKTDQKYYAKMIWAARLFNPDGKTPKKDSENPDAALRNRPRQGLVFVTDLTYDGSEYTGGKLYDMESGKTYDCKLKMNSDDDIQIRGFMKISMFGKTIKWKRVVGK